MFLNIVNIRRYLLPISLAVVSFGIVLPGILYHLSQSWKEGRGTPPSQSARIQPGAAASPSSFDEKEIFRISQAAVGNQVGDYVFVDRSGRKVRLSDYRGKPLVISMIFTHCPFVCANMTRNLKVLKASQAAFGEDSFGVLTVGFDTENDTPEAMDDFAKRMGIELTNWEFVSSDAETIGKLSRDLGFSFFPTEEGGFNHITQTTFVDAQGKVYRQIYGEEFDNKTLLEPLREMIYNIKTAEPGLAGLTNKVKLFCTVYDTESGKYKVDYSYFYGLGISLLFSFIIAWWIIYEYRRIPPRRDDRHDHD